MSYKKAVLTIRCDGPSCNATIELPLGVWARCNWFPYDEAVAVFIKAGWIGILSVDDKHYCPNCVMK